MSAKEKAKELFDKYCYAIRTEENGSGYYTNVIYAKNCALIAVDEILFVVSKYNDTQAEVSYWQEVKQEIEKL